MTLGPEPSTVTLVLSRVARQALIQAQQRGAPIVLMMAGVTAPTKQPIRINVFLNKPDADQHTPVSDPTFVGYIHLDPGRKAEHRKGGVSRAFDISTVAIVNDSPSIAVTLVPVVGLSEKPRDLQLKIDQISIYIERH